MLWVCQATIGYCIETKVVWDHFKTLWSIILLLHEKIMVLLVLFGLKRCLRICQNFWLVTCKNEVWVALFHCEQNWYSHKLFSWPCFWNCWPDTRKGKGSGRRCTSCTMKNLIACKWCKKETGVWKRRKKADNTSF